MSRPIALALLSLCAACREQAPCKGLDAVIASASSAPGYEARAPLVAQGVARACPTLPKEWSKVLSANTVEGRKEAFAGAYPSAPTFWNDACVRGAASLRMLGALSRADRREAVFRDCEFERLGFSTANEYAGTEGNSDFVLALTAPGLFHWLVERRVDRSKAATVARLVAGVPAPLNVLGRSVHPEVPSSPLARRPRADLQIAIGKLGVEIGDRQICLDPYLAQFRGAAACDPALPASAAVAIAQDAAAARARGAGERPVAALIADRGASFDRVARALDAARKAGVGVEVIAEAAEEGWAGIPIELEAPAGAVAVHVFRDGSVRVGAGSEATVLGAPSGRPDLKELHARLAAIRAANAAATALAVSADAEVEFGSPYLVVAMALLPERQPLFERVAVVRAATASGTGTIGAAAPEP